MHEIGHRVCNKGKILNSCNLSVLLNIFALCFIKYLLTEKIGNVHLMWLKIIGYKMIAVVLDLGRTN